MASYFSMLLRNLKPSTLNISALLFCMLCLSNCAAPDEETSAPNIIRVPWPANDRVSRADSEVPPFELSNSNLLGSGRFNSVFWLDFEGATVESRQSFIVAKANQDRVQIPAFAAEDIGSEDSIGSLKEEILEGLIALFPDVDIRLTTIQPRSRPFSRVHIGGRNFTGKSRVLGVAPLDLGNLSGNDVLFVFSQELSGHSPQEAKPLLIQVIAHEIAHALGARHIENIQAIMRPSASLSANTFDVSGPVVDTPEQIEHSLDVLINSAGSLSRNRSNLGLPNIVNLAAYSTGDVVQYSVISGENMLANPGLNLADFHYEWTFEDTITEGQSVLMTFDDREDHRLELKVTDDQNGETRTFLFSVGRRG